MHVHSIQISIIIVKIPIEIIIASVKNLSISAGTLGFFLNGVAYPNGSIMQRTDIGEGDNALQCTTDSTICCRNTGGETRAGDFYMPNGSLVLLNDTTTNGYYRSRESQHIRLNRRSPGTITGQFRCNIPQANGALAELYINIGECKIHFIYVLYIIVRDRVQGLYAFKRPKDPGL